MTEPINTGTEGTPGDLPALYVGTYAKYNAGSIAGAWLVLEDFANRDDFLEAAHALHENEADPELMFQDFQAFPEHWYAEGSAPPADLWEWLELDEHDRTVYELYAKHVADEPGGVTEAIDAFAGTFATPEDWAREFIEDTGQLASMAENLRSYFDYEAFARDAAMDMDFVRHDGEVWVFYRY